ncbi:MAG TPA: 2-phospho-L-lactate transferase [Burkholderiales bacterium]|nr:2-phospho-L-lactate transferase [Burkholderiales bacterium]
MTMQRAGSGLRQPNASSVLALCGGVGGSKLVLGLRDVLRADELTVVVNTADDFEHLGLHVSPDLDTVLYTLAGLSDPVRGWGRAEETWNFMDALASLGSETWFALGDRDLAVHVERTRRLRAGESLTSIVADMAARLKVAARIVPMTDGTVRTVVHTRDGPLPFQDYFVRHRCAPVVSAISFAGAPDARPSPAFVGAIEHPALTAVVIAPSNPYLSIDPILAVPGVREALEHAPVPVIAVSPIIRGKAVKGPTAKIMAELGIDVTPGAIARHYSGLIDGLVIDESDAGLATAIGVPVTATRTLMNDVDDRRQLAREVLAFAHALPVRGGSRMNRSSGS